MNTGFIPRNGVLAIAASMAVAGTSHAHMASDYLAQEYGWLRPITSPAPSRSSSAYKAPALTPHEIVSEFRDDGLPIAVIADISGVERKTVYAWLSGDGAVRAHNQERLEQLYALLTKGKVAEFKHLYRFWNRNTAHDVSLGFLLKQPELDSVAISGVLDELWPLAQKQQNLARETVVRTSLKTNPFVRGSHEVGLSHDV